MKRRDFIRKGSIVSATPFLMTGLTSLLSRRFLAPLIESNCQSDIYDRVLVVIRMQGGNDGLNTIVPLNQFVEYKDLRPDIKLFNNSNSFNYKLDNNYGLHPALGELNAGTSVQHLWDNNKLGVVQGVGYHNPNFSHFASENIVFAGKDGDTASTANEGIWANYINQVFPNAAQNISSWEDPLAIHIGNPNPVLSFHKNGASNTEYNFFPFQSAMFNAGSNGVIDQTNLDYNPDSGPHGVLPSDYRHLYNYLGNVRLAMDGYYHRIISVFNAGQNSAVNYPGTDLAKQLRVVARMIKGGSRTKLYMVTLPKFDTHKDQVQGNNTTQGVHSDLLKTFSQAVSAFQKDLENLNVDHKVLTVSFSEFGRKAEQNGQLGTDHGNVAPVFIIGSSARNAIIGGHPDLNSVTKMENGGDGRFSGEIKFQFNALYRDIVRNWFGGNNSVINSLNLTLNSNYNTNLPNVVKMADRVPNNCRFGQHPDYVPNNARVISNETNEENNVQFAKGSVSAYSSRPYIFVKFSGFERHDVAIVSIFDISGKLISMERTDMINEYRFLMGDRPQQVYIVRVESDRKVEGFKVFY